ncbi:MAG: hypothetical protein QNK37_27855 [Acidobacteriota bacterium]|nr:hypothetical protein [Acidobacteriota bacterium]
MVDQEKKSGHVKLRHTPKKPALIVPKSLAQAQMVMEAIDREIAFYRRRAGQVFFLGLLVEILILAGKQTDKVVIPNDPAWVKSFAFSCFFIAVAAVGIALGHEYRSRIRFLKDSRSELLEKLEYEFVYSSEADQGLSEIQVLYVVLVFLSSSGIILSWLSQIKTLQGFPFWLFLTPLILIGTIGILYSLKQLFRWYKAVWRSRNRNKK